MPRPENETATGSRPFSAVRFVREDDSPYQTPVYFVPSASAEVDTGSTGPVLMQPQRSPVRDWMRRQSNDGPSPALKRTRSPMLQRDSLKSRYSPGRPGSRRYRRWMNDTMLREALDEDDLKEIYSVEHHSSLSDLFYGDNMQKWDEFCAMSEEEQRQYLRKALHNHDPVPQKPTNNPRVLYDRLDRKVKAMLKRGVGREFLADFEQQLCALLHVEDAMDAEWDRCGVEFMLVKSSKGAVVELGDSMHRLVAHAVCLFHSLQSQTRQPANRASNKELVITFPYPSSPSCPPRPQMLLHEYLQIIDDVELAAEKGELEGELP
mmetsp:Transcript_61906/g.128066  ORF Transcript_61906/g.128066 Transcript_61906/m.128066 type:complete len:321 (-) Transcript_61906:90-1052(-)